MKLNLHCSFLLIANCLALWGCGGQPAKPLSTLPIKVSQGNLESHIDEACFAEGIALDQPKGLLQLQCDDGIVLVVLADGKRWPQSVLGKRVKLQGIVSVHVPLTNSDGEPVDGDGRSIQGYSTPYHFIGKAKILSVP